MTQKPPELKKSYAIGLFLLVGIATTVLSAILNPDRWLPEWLTNFSTGMIGAAITFYIIDVIIGERERREAVEKDIQREKDDLEREERRKIDAEERDLLRRKEEDQKERKTWILEMGSANEVIALNAALKLKSSGALQDGTLRGVDLRYAQLSKATMFVDADLQYADFTKANLIGIILRGANLRGGKFEYAQLTGATLNNAEMQHTTLWKANLETAGLYQANLQGANLQYANLSNAFLQGANLQEANLYQANLCGTNLENADIRKANLLDAKFNENTILPNGRKFQSIQDFIEFKVIMEPAHLPE